MTDDYPPIPPEATVETLWKSLNDLHEYALEAIAAEKARADNAVADAQRELALWSGPAQTSTDPE